MNFARFVLNKINEAVTDPFCIKEFLSAKIKSIDAVEESDLLSLYEVDCFFDLYLNNPHIPSVKYRIFHLPTSKEKEVLNLFHQYKEKLVVLCKSSTQCYVSSTLQNICSLIRTRSIWSPAHIAVEAGLRDVYNKDSKLSQWFDSQSCEMHYTPLHLACLLNDGIITSELIDGGADISLKDDKGNTALHLAVLIKAEKAIIYLCKAADKKVMNLENTEGDTALHVAAKLNSHQICTTLLNNGASSSYCNRIALPIHYALKYESNLCLKVLLEHDSNQVKAPCKKHGGVPLHWCKQKEQVEILSKFNSPTDCLSNDSHTPLHIMIVRGRLEAAKAIILGSAKVNTRGKHGNTALHLAVLYDYPMLVKMLILFGSNHSITNDFGETSGIFALRNTKANKEIIVEILSSIGGISASNPSPVSITFKRKRVPKKEQFQLCSGFRLLCLDGGGIKGLISTQILMLIEQLCGKPAKDLFDWIAGTSTGGILALALAQGKEAVEVQKLYFRLKNQVFVGSRPYSAEPFEEFLKQEFGEHKTMKDISYGPRVIVTTTLADRKPMRLHLFRNYEDVENNIHATSNHISTKVSSSADICKLQETIPSLSQPLWKVARCSGSAPTYFRPMGGFLDGGLIANNPTLDALVEIHNFCKKNPLPVKKIRLVVSIGTGSSKLTLARSVDVCRPTNPMSLVHSARAGLELSQMLIDVTTESSAHVVDRAQAWCEMIEALYYRLSPLIDTQVFLDEKDDTKLLNLMWEAHVYVYNNKSLIEEIAKHLCANS